MGEEGGLGRGDRRSDAFRSRLFQRLALVASRREAVVLRELTAPFTLDCPLDVAAGH